MSSAAVVERSPSASGPVLMTRDEARACVDRIRKGLDSIRVDALALYEGEGWTALGYKTFRECAKAEFGKSEAYVYRLVDAARADRAISPIGENLTPIPESHAREMAPVNDDEERMRAVYSRALESSGGKPTAAVVHDEVDRELGREPVVRVARSLQPPQPVNPRRKSDPIPSQDIPDERLLAGSDLPDLDVNNEARKAGPAERFCSDCGDRYVGSVCPCSQQPSPPPPAATFQPAPKTHRFGSGIGSSKSQAPRISSLSDRTLDAGDLARALFDMPADQIVEAITELDAPAEKKQALRQALGGSAPPAVPAAPTPKVDIREALGDDGCTVLELSKAISETFTVDARASLLALLADDMPAERLSPLSHRLNVRVKNTGNLIEPEPVGELCTLKDVEAAISEHLTSNDVRLLESELPMLRKEIGKRERDAEKAAQAAEASA